MNIITRLAAWYAQRARARRFRIFAGLLSSLPRPLRILDVGGTIESWCSLDLAALGEISVLVLNVRPEPSFSAPHNRTYQVGNCTFAFVQGDGRDLSRFADCEFDVVFSQSTLAYAGSFADQCRMAREIKRSGRRYFVQTPNKRFPLDWRTLVPFFQYLPIPWQARAFRVVRVHSDRAAHLMSIRDLNYPELASLFPHATLVPERVLGLTKSWMVHSGFDTAEIAQALHKSA